MFWGFACFNSKLFVLRYFFFVRLPFTFTFILIVRFVWLCGCGVVCIEGLDAQVEDFDDLVMPFRVKGLSRGGAPSYLSVNRGNVFVYL